MSLFRCKTRWSVTAGNGSDEDQCDSGCVLASSVFCNDDQEVIIIGTQAGILRVFRPHGPKDGDARALPSDLILEWQLGQPILQIASGTFVSGSTDHQLAILAPRSVSVHALQVAMGENDLAHACAIHHVFERSLPDTVGCAWQLLVGRFGAGAAAVNTMSLGVVTSDGALAVYEREARNPLMLQLFSPEELPLPGPVTYCSAKDAFLVITPSWQLHSHKYMTLAQAGREYRLPDWNVSLGDPAIELEIVATSSAHGGREPTLAGPELLVLGQRSLACWQWAGTLRFARRLPAPPRCMSHHIADGSLMVLVASETLLLYRDGVLCWTSQPPFPPVVMSTITLEGIPGHQVLVSDSLEIHCCVLGTEPTLFRAPPPFTSAPESAENMRQELARISEGMKSLQLGASATQPELTAQMVLKTAGNATRGTLRLGVVAPVSLVCVSITTSPPISASPASVSISSLCNSVEIPVAFDAFPSPAPANLDVHVTVSYGKATNGAPHVTQAEVVTLPLNLVLTALSPQIHSQSQAPLRLSFAFKGDASKALKLLLPGVRQSPGSTITLQDGSGTIVTLILIAGAAGGMCHISSTSIALASLVAHCVLVCPGFQPSITTVPESVTWLNKAVDRFYTACRNFKLLEVEVEKTNAWLRQVQLRLLNRYKDRSAQTLHGLDTLLFDAFGDINSAANKLIDAEKELDLSGRELTTVLNMCCHLLAATEPTPKPETISETRASLFIDNVDRTWVECVTAALEKDTKGPISSLSDAQPARVKSLLARCLVRLIKAPNP